MSRTTNLIRNTIYGVAGKVLTLLLSFASRTAFIFLLGDTYLGVNGLYTEVLSVLSVAELGFGTAMIYAMYGPIARKDDAKIVQLLDFYKKMYRLIALVIATLGICLLPFLQHIVKGADTLTLRELRIYYLIFLFNTVVNYFVTYKYSFVNAQQLNYIVNTFDAVVNMAVIAVQILVILITRNFLAYLLAQSAMLLLSRVAAALYLNRRFPLLKQKPEMPLPKEERRGIFTEVKALAFFQFASAAVHSTDNIIISSLRNLGVTMVGLVSNYTLIINNVVAFVDILFINSTSGFGNLVAEGTTEQYRKAFHEMSFLASWLYGFCSIAFFVLLPPFITLWIGEEKLIDTMSLLLLSLNCFLLGTYAVYYRARNAKGNFGKDKWLAMNQAVVNLVVSVICARAMGLPGVYVGTVVSRLYTIISRPLRTYRFLFDASPREYYLRLAGYFLTVVTVGLATWLLCGMVLTEVTLLRFAAAVCTVAVVPNVLFALAYFRTEECAALLYRVKDILGGRKK